MLMKVVLGSHYCGSFTDFKAAVLILPQFSSFSLQQGDGCSNSDCGCLLCLLVARNSDSKSTWSPGSVTNTSLAHELWKVPLPPKSITAPSRPPPGLTGQKPPLSTWDNSLRLGGGWGNSDARYTPGKDVPVCPGGLWLSLSLPWAGHSVLGTLCWAGLGQDGCWQDTGHRCSLCPQWSCLCQGEAQAGHGAAVWLNLVPRQTRAVMNWIMVAQGVIRQASKPF